MLEARVKVDWRRWVADCPNPDCTNAQRVVPGQSQLHCDPPPDGCGQRSALLWPDDPAAVMSRVADRPDRDAHWDPADDEEPADAA